MIFHSAIDQLSVYFTSKKYEEEVLGAKAEYFRDVGIDDKENERYEQWMNLFFDWYLFSRPLEGLSLSPSLFALEIDEFQSQMKEREVFVQLAEGSHGLFQFVKIKGDQSFYKDLLSNKKCIVQDSSFSMTLSKGAICDFRTVRDSDGNLHVTKGFCSHPMDASKFILKQVKEHRKSSLEDKEALLLKLVRMFFKLEQYSHLESAQVYTLESKVRF